MKRRRTLSICLAFILMLAVAAPVPAFAKAKSAGPLLKSVTVYNYSTNGTSGKWRKSSVTKFTYDKNNYPTLIARDSDSSSSKTLKYKYKKKKKTPKSAKEYNAANRKTGTYKYNKKGQVTSYKDSSFLKLSGVKNTYKYNKKGFVYQYIRVDSGKDFWGTSSWKYTDTYKYAYTFKKGVPRKLTVNYSSKDWSSGSGTYTYSGKNFVNFNAKGLVTSWGYFNSDGTKRLTYTITYTKKKGKITTATVKYVDYNGVATLDKKYKFAYKKKTSTSKSRFSNMINDQILSFGSYGTYNWY